MHQKDPANTVFQLAADLVSHTSQHVFLTGKAGTGKTTFLKYIKEHSSKHIVIVAPTGVAAINAGGVTMHSFFQLPRGMFVPGTVSREDFIGFVEATDRHSLFKNIHFNSAKRELIQELELLIIDEVSMMRCDMLDAIDAILRHFRRSPHTPFGGVQVLYIGDMFQLPPVISNEEWNVLQQHYQSPFFFSAKVVAEAPPLYIELKKIYRQNEQQFIDVLNRIRNNMATAADFSFLNSRYDPSFTPAGNEHYITITTHNKRAESINNEALSKLGGKLYSFKASVVDDFGDKSYPTDLDLQLKPGAQIMFIKNDTSPERRYFNGKLAIVSSIAGDEIRASFDDGSEDFLLEKETWKNIRYIYDKENDDIDEEVLGSFTQYPVRLAWAITVHKSQGLSFDKAIIDAGASFAPGQVYVALSRCMSVGGMVLKSRLHPQAISTDKRIVEFAKQEVSDPAQLRAIVEKEKYIHWGNALMRLFDFSRLLSGLSDWQALIAGKKLPNVDATLDLAHSLILKGRELASVGQKFRKQLGEVLEQARQSGDVSLLVLRMEKAICFFGEGLTKDILVPLREHMAIVQYAGRLSKYKEELAGLEAVVWQHVDRLVKAKYDDKQFVEPALFALYDPARKGKEAKPMKKVKAPAGSSQLISLQLFREGKSLAEIASIRNMAISTIESHMAAFVATGELAADALVHPEKIDAICKVIDESGVTGAGAIKHKLGENYSFHEIRVVFNHLRRRQADATRS
ncbi:MAG TPA: helix-turn-helix domain-containing protein [Flavisolibacter sp.]|nr:helix-turn-helix domain-containing protein [Flavisolibacter sp.]